MSDRDSIIRERIQELGEESFPDDEVAWSVQTIVHKGPYSAVEAVPSPATVGYEKCRFILGFTNPDTCFVVGSYCWNGSGWSLLFSDPRARDDWQKLFNPT